jgi:cell division protein FtsL
LKIDNSQVVREVDPRASRELFWLLVLVMTLVGGLGLYAWPHLKIRETARAQDRMSRERERLLEANRKLRLEKASLENLRRVEAIATRELGLSSPPAGRVIVIEPPRAPASGAQLAKELGALPGTPAAGGERN